MYLARGPVFMQNNTGLHAFLEFAAVPFCPLNAGLMNLLSISIQPKLLVWIQASFVTQMYKIFTTWAAYLWQQSSGELMIWDNWIFPDGRSTLNS